MQSLSDILNGGHHRQLGERHPIIRAGERAEISGWVRSAVWYRDRGRCELCGFLPVEGAWHLDHIKPWSAGGPDTTDNLRVLCEDHNLGRSNRYEPTERPRRPATWWCLNCFGEQLGSWWQWAPNGTPTICPVHGAAFSLQSTRCPVIRLFLRLAKAGEPITDWHHRYPLTDDDRLTVAYCAHCNAPALTGYTL